MKAKLTARQTDTDLAVYHIQGKRISRERSGFEDAVLLPLKTE